ncbi:MAG: CDP-alcohol phosphatidyltransferase family protein [Candidatus Methanomethylophilaceae archaeon]|nr:CDP-alcohol phosphatidyltransferase family protein [Candidatus Methanomethylophilaceae archaeon]
MPMHPAVPNVLSIGRLVGSVALPFAGGLTTPFYIIFSILCITDLLDGHIARRYGLCTPKGELLDSVADFILVVCMLIVLVAYIDWEWWMISLIAVVIALRSLSVVVGTLRFKRPALIHTFMNKASGLVIHLAPFMIPVFGTGPVILLTCTLSAVAASEELLINATSPELDRNRRSYL